MPTTPLRLAVTLTVGGLFAASLAAQTRPADTPHKPNAGQATTRPVSKPATRPADPDSVPKNIVLMIADGAGYSLLDATRYWTGEPLAVDSDEWDRVSAATYSLRRAGVPPRGLDYLEQDPTLVYDPAAFYDDAPVPGALGLSPGDDSDAPGTYPRGFAGYERHRASYPDSANTASALVTGVSSYSGSINVDGKFQPVRTLAEAAKEAGKRVGVVTSVPFTHATPAAAAGTHSPSRAQFHAIGSEFLRAGVVDAFAGAGHPRYDADGKRREKATFKRVAPEDWIELETGTLTEGDPDGTPWTLVESTEAIQRLAEFGRPTPKRMAIVPAVGDTLQQERTSPDRDGNGKIDHRDAREAAPFEDPLTPGLPTLAEMTLATLNAVDDDADGFVLIVEGGAPDWASHDNQLGRAIEEYLGFDAAIRAVVAYLEAGTNGHTFDNTLVVVTADHDHMLFGPDAATVAFEAVQDRGPGVLPGHRWMFNAHSNLPVAVFSRGAGGGRIAPLATKSDDAEVGGRVVGRGPYLHQTDLGKLLINFVDAADEPRRDVP